MVIIFNKANRPIGIAGQSVLPNKEIRVKDKDAYCAVYDEHGNDTGKKKILPGLKALEKIGFVTISVEEEVKSTQKEKPAVKEAEPVVEENSAEEKKTTKGKRKTKKTEE